MISNELLKRYYSDKKYNLTDYFFEKIRSAATPSTRLLNLGAGPSVDQPVCSLKGEVAEVVGADIDPAVMQNPALDRAVVLDGKTLPFPDQSFDLAYSDYVLEHVETPMEFLTEVYRVLKPGGCFFIRTPNIYHYVTIISRTTPHWFHEAVANRARGLPKEAHAPYPTFYRINSRRALQDAATTVGFSRVELEMLEGHPAYLMFSSIPFLAGVAYERTVNSTPAFAGLRANIYAQLTK